MYRVVLSWLEDITVVIWLKYVPEFEYIDPDTRADTLEKPDNKPGIYLAAALLLHEESSDVSDDTLIDDAVIPPLVFGENFV